MAVINCLSIWKDYKPMQRNNLQSTAIEYEERIDCLPECLKKGNLSAHMHA